MIGLAAIVGAVTSILIAIAGLFGSVWVFQKNKSEQRRHDLLVARRQAYVDFLNALNRNETVMQFQKGDPIEAVNDLSCQLSLLRLFAPNSVNMRAIALMIVHAAELDKDYKMSKEGRERFATSFDELLKAMREDLKDELLQENDEDSK